MLVRSLILSIAVLLLWSLPAGAADGEENPYLRKGPYVSFGGAAAIATTTSEFDFVRSSGGLYAEGGYRGKYLAAEVEFTWISENNQYTLIPTFRGYLPWFRDAILEGRIQPYIEVGAGTFYAQTAKTNGWGGTVKAGGGVDFHLDPDWALEVAVDYLHGTGRWHGWNRVGISFGALRRF